MGPLNMNEDASSHVSHHEANIALNAEQHRAMTGFFVNQVASLIGQFQLEPDRVLACVLDVCEDQLLPSRFLLRRFGAGSIAQVLGFNFQIYQVC